MTRIKQITVRPAKRQSSGEAVVHKMNLSLFNSLSFFYHDIFYKESQTHRAHRNFLGHSKDDEFVNPYDRHIAHSKSDCQRLLYAVYGKDAPAIWLATADLFLQSGNV